MCILSYIHILYIFVLSRIRIKHVWLNLNDYAYILATDKNENGIIKPIILNWWDGGNNMGNNFIVERLMNISYYIYVILDICV